MTLLGKSGTFSGGSVEADTVKTTTRMVYDGSDNLTYVGMASPGTQTSEAKWSIRQLTYSGTNLSSVLWADGNANADNIWDNYLSYTYS